MGPKAKRPTQASQVCLELFYFALNYLSFLLDAFEEAKSGPVWSVHAARKICES
jgi:hypothetical protein